MKHRHEVKQDQQRTSTVRHEAANGYHAFFHCFNSGRFYEAHDVLEAVWLPLRLEEDGDFFKGLIQLAGAFVHVQKGRFAPATSLLRRARFHLEPYPTPHRGLSVTTALDLIDRWLDLLSQSPPPGGFLGQDQGPKLRMPALNGSEGGSGACRG
jgi:predicted metal-dependent hydrolase